MCLVADGVQAGNAVGQEMFLLNETFIWLVQIQSVHSGVWWLFVELSLCVVDLVFVLCGRAAVRRSHFSVDGRRDVAAAASAAMLVVVGHGQIEQAGAGGQVDVLHVLHLRPTHRTQLKLTGAGLAAHHVAAGAERGIYLLLAAQHAQQSLSELLQPLLQGPALLAAATVQPLVLLVVSARGA